MIGSPGRRRAVLAVLVVVILACAAAVTYVVTQRGAGDGLGDRLESLKDDAPPTSDDARDREQLIQAASRFAGGFYTYGAEMLDDSGHLPDYAALTEIMTPKFGEVFTNFVTLAEQTVAEVDAESVGEVDAAGVGSQDEDSAVVLVAGTVTLSATYQQEGEDAGDDPIEVTGDPRSFRFEIDLVKIDGEWLVDEVDDIDDGLPPLSQPSIPEEPGTAPSTPPTGQPSAPTPSGEPTTSPSEDG